MVLIAVVMLLANYVGLTINITPSIRQGFYVRSSGEIGKGDIVSVCLREPYKRIALERGYLGKSKKCFGSDPLVKEVLAVPG